MQKKIVVVFHSGYGHTKKQAEAVAKGAQATLIEISQEGEITVSALESASVFSEISSSHLKSITSSLDFHHDHSRTC